MGQILESFTLEDNNENIYFVATLDIESETEEGYCLTVGDGYTDGCTSFGHGVSALTLALETYQAVRNLSELLAKHVEANPVDGITPTQHFWNLFCEEFEDGWLYYDAQTDSIVEVVEDKGSGALYLCDFISKWRAEQTEVEVKIICPRCQGDDISYHDSQGYEMTDPERHHYLETATYHCNDLECDHYFNVNFAMKPVRVHADC